MKIDRPIATAIILFIILLLMFFLVVPEYKNFKKLQLELGEKKAEFNAKFNYYAEITRTYFDLKSHEEDIKKVDDALPDNPNFGDIVYFLQQTANENGLTVKNLFLSKSSSNKVETTTNAVKDIIFSIDILGSHASLEGFIVALEKSSRIFEVSNISFNSDSDLSSQSFSMQIVTHSY